MMAVNLEDNSSSLRSDICDCINKKPKECSESEFLSRRPQNIPFGARTSDYYETDKNLPERFNNPDSLKGYEEVKINPLYRTTNSEYGRLQPNVHTMSVVYHSRKQDFSKRYMKGGNYRNHSLNTALDRQII